MALIRDWSVTASANNGDSSEGYFRESMQFSEANNAFREMQAMLARDRSDNNGTVVAGGSTSSYVLSVSQSLSSYADGDTFVFQAPAKASGASTIRVNSLSDKPLKRTDGTNLADGEIAAGGTYRAWYKSASGAFHVEHLSGVQDRSAVNATLTSYALEHPLSNFPIPFGVGTPRMIASVVSASDYTSGIVGTSGTLYFHPFYVNRTISVSRISVYITVPGVTSTLKLGIYSHSEANGRPGTRLAITSNFSTTSSGTAGGNISLTLNEGLYYVAWYPSAVASLPAMKRIADNAVYKWRGFNAGPSTIYSPDEETLTASLAGSGVLSYLSGDIPAIFLKYS